MMRFIFIFIAGLITLSSAATVITDKNQYNTNEAITVSLTQMQGDAEDWVGVYPVGSSNDWANVVAWDWTGGIESGNLILTVPNIGDYEVRAFFANSLNTEATSQPFNIQQAPINTTVTPSKAEYLITENITVHFEDMSGNSEDWIGIYPKDATNDWENVVAWSWTNGRVSGDISFDPLASGDYEVRAFFSNGFETKAEGSFKVVVNQSPTIYEDGEDGTIDRWESKGDGAVSNKPIGYNSTRSIYTPAVWRGWDLGYTSHYELTNIAHTSWNNTTQRILRFEHKTPGSPCFVFGVYVSTLQGPRVMTWSMWYERNNMPPTKIVYDGGNVELMYPVADAIRYNHDWQPHSYDLEERLKIIEPNNSITSVDAFYTTGGKYYDNIRLESE